MRKLFWLGLALLGGVACTAVESGSEPAPIRATPGKEDIIVNVGLDGESAVVDIMSESGIGAVHLALTEGSWPDTIELRLHLKGLENLTVAYADTIIEAAVASHGEMMVLESVSAEAGQQPIDETDPAWLQIDVVSSGEPAIPLEDGIFRVMMPPAFFASGANQFDVSWIDFYR